jgi:hypothetical protein
MTVPGFVAAVGSQDTNDKGRSYGNRDHTFEIRFLDSGVQAYPFTFRLESGWTVDRVSSHYVGAPNRYGLPAFYELHVWA